MTRYRVTMALVIAVGCVVALASGQWLSAVALFGVSILIVREDRELRRADAKKDLREIYPPKRDQFQRDLERLNNLRAARSSPAPTEVTVKRECTGSYDCTCMVKPKKSWRDRHPIAGPTYGAILEGFRDGCAHMLWIGVVVLVVAAVAGAGFLLGMGIESLL